MTNNRAIAVVVDIYHSVAYFEAAAMCHCRSTLYKVEGRRREH